MNCGEFIKEFSDSEYSNDENNAPVIKRRRKSDDSNIIRKSKLYCEECDTGKSLSEALIFASTNQQYDDRLFIELQVQYLAHVIKTIRFTNSESPIFCLHA